MDYNSKNTGAEVQAILDSVAGKQEAILDLDTIREGAAKGATALQEEQYKGTVTGVTFYGKDYTPDSDGKVYMGYPDVGAVKEITINGSTKTPTNGGVDLGTVLTQHQDISQKADLSNGKILASQLPDYILGQVMYGGVIQSGDANSIVVQPSANYKAKYSLEGNTVTVVKYQFWSQQGVYFISGKNGTFLDLEVKVGDWLISTGSSVAKVDNTDAVSSVAGLTGVIDASALGKELSYNDLKDKPTIPAAVTESTVSGWGFTKNTGTYSKPSGGIPKTDLASAVQTSLGKADTAVQPAAISDFVTTESLAAVATSGSYNDLTDQPDFIKGVAINGTTIANTSGTVYLPNASTGGYGITRLNSSISSTSTLESATPSAVKAAYDLANSKQDTLVSGTNIKTINGQSIVGSGDLTIESGAQVYELDLTGRGNFEGYITEEEWNIIKTSDRIKIITDIFSTEIVQIYSPILELNGDIAVFGSMMGMQGGVITQYMFTGANATEGSPYSYQISEVHIPTQTSQLENDSNFISSDNLKTINGQSIVGSGNLIIEGGSGGNYVEKEVVGETVVANVQGFNTNNMVYGLPDAVAKGDADDYLVSRGTLKTINGESLVGEGDITISGGSGSGAYQQINHGSNSGYYTLVPNTFHVWDEVGYLELSLAPETSGVANEYIFQFTSGSTATSLTLPDDIKWANDAPPTIAENMIYQISILKGLASCLEFSNKGLFPATIVAWQDGYAELYSYFMNNYSLPDSDKPSGAIECTEQITVEDTNGIVDGNVIKVSLGLSDRVFFFTEKSIDNYYAVYINKQGVCGTYMYD